MHVGVNLGVGQFDKEQHHRKHRGRQDIAVSIGERMLDMAVAHQASIHESENGITIQLLDFRT